MSDFKYTRGPWRAVYALKATAEDVEKKLFDRVYSTANGVPVCALSKLGRLDEVTGNALLVAHAPELFEFIEGWAAVFESNATDENVESFVATARELLAQVRAGGQSEE